MFELPETPACYTPIALISLLAGEYDRTISRKTIYDLLNSGQIKGKKFGRRTVIAREEITRFLNNLPDYLDNKYLVTGGKGQSQHPK